MCFQNIIVMLNSAELMVYPSTNLSFFVMKYWNIRERISGGGRRWGRNERYGWLFGGFGTLGTHQDFGKHKIGRYEKSDIFDFFMISDGFRSIFGIWSKSWFWMGRDRVSDMEI